jgi:hypothetical protein
MRRTAAVASLLLGMVVSPHEMWSVERPETAIERRDACREALAKLPVGESLSSLPANEARAKSGTKEYYLAREHCKYFIAEYRGPTDFPNEVSVDRGNGVVTEHSFYVPSAMPTSLLARVFVWWADGNPDKLQENLEASLIDALEQAFPCEGPWDSGRAQANSQPTAAGNQASIPDSCPLCGSEQVLKIVYGLAYDDVEETTVWPGGCFRRDSRWHCPKCAHEWGR